MGVLKDRSFAVLTANDGGIGPSAMSIKLALSDSSQNLARCLSDYSEYFVFLPG
jgi:hypothetical protein